MVFVQLCAKSAVAHLLVFPSLYKFCEGMFRRETRHSHFFCEEGGVMAVAYRWGCCDEVEGVWLWVQKKDPYRMFDMNLPCSEAGD